MGTWWPDGRKPRPSRRKAKAARYRKLRPLVRAAAHEKDGGRCVWPTCRRYLTLEAAHEHEVVWRGRGGDPCDLEIVVTTCAGCHLDMHPRVGGIRKRMEGTRAEGFRYYERQGKTWQEVR